MCATTATHVARAATLARYRLRWQRMRRWVGVDAGGGGGGVDECRAVTWVVRPLMATVVTRELHGGTWVGDDCGGDVCGDGYDDGGTATGGDRCAGDDGGVCGGWTVTFAEPASVMRPVAATTAVATAAGHGRRVVCTRGGDGDSGGMGSGGGGDGGACIGHNDGGAAACDGGGGDG